MSRMWEVDPETRAKLLQISKTNENDRCCDCNAPSPQWASPKFGIFICLNCAGTHRGLGVHISFVRSITMDAFKTGEIHRMEQGGNEPWKSFFDNHAITQSEGRTFEDSTIKERYEGEVGEEWKERLAAKVEGREYVPGQREVKKKKETPAAAGPSSISNTGPRGSSPALSEGGGGGKKERNEAYFAKLGTANATRSESLPPSQGGKFTGFGGGLPPSSPAGSRSSFMGGAGGAPALDDFQKDPMGTLTKGFGWFTSAVGKSAKTVHDSYIQPTAKQLAESDFAAQARLQAAHLGQNIQVGARGAADQFNRFIEGQDEHTASLARRRGEPERKDFWDDFAALGAEGQGQGQHRRSASRPNAIGTAAMKPGATGAATGTGATGSAGASGSGSGGSATGTAKGQGQQHEEGWDEDW